VSPRAPDFQSLFQAVPDLYLVLTPDFIIVAASDAYLLVTMTNRSSILGRVMFDAFPDNPDDPAASGTRHLQASLERVLRRKSPDTMAVQRHDLRKPQSEGGGFEERFWSLTNLPVLGPDNEIAYIIHAVKDVTEAIRLEQLGIEKDKLKGELQTEEIFSKAFNASPEPISIVALRDATFLDVNEAFLRTTGFRRGQVIGHTPTELGFWKPEEMAEYANKLKNNKSLRDLEIPFRTKSGEERVGLHSAEIIEIAGRRCSLNILEDITEGRSLEKQLRQAQKMEAIGQLAGGIAHDFNNLLGVILGYGEALEDQLAHDPEVRKKAEEITKAARRAADLTRQLLAFSRQQVLEPKVLNLNVVVADLERMLQRLIGEHIELTTILDSSLDSIRADEGQIGQVIMNLAVNARDAMPTGGKIIIETANVELDADYAHQHPPTVVGSYVLLTITDTGTGMNAETQAHIFEPFFTTKELGRGTGLGLATVYGVVKQCGGYIWVSSEVGYGTTFKIYLPRVGEAAHPQSDLVGPIRSAHGSETILLVEDDDALRSLIQTFLLEGGFTVLEANGPGQASEVAHRYEGQIHLLLSDVVMPGMSGPQLADELVSLRSDMKILFISGYPGNSIVRRGLLEGDVRVLQKPFTRATLLQYVDETLERERAPNRSS